MNEIEQNNEIVAPVVSKSLITDLLQIINQAKWRVAATVNSELTMMYWHIGERINREVLENQRAEYGKQLLIQLSEALTNEFGKGFSTQNLYYCRQFYLTFPEIFHTPCGILTWSHYRRLLSVTNKDARDWYLHEAASQMWSYATLNRNISTQYYERLLMSQDKEPVREEMLLKTRDFDRDKLEFVKNPIVTEFLGMSPTKAFVESDLETALLDNLQKFLLELGKGFLFEARQKRFSFDEDNFYVDLVFYNRLLQCYVLIDLKTKKLTHQDLGQMQMYVNYYDRYERQEWEKPTIGILLCKEKSDALVELTLPKDANIYAQQYALCLPDKHLLQAKLKEWIDEIEEK